MGVALPVFPLQNFVPVGYKGNILGQNVSFLTTGSSVTNGGQVVKQGHQSVVVNTSYDWLNTYTGQACTVIFQGQNTSSAPLDKILMVYVDNSSNPNEINVYWPDSGQFTVAPPYTAGYYYVFTSGVMCTVYNGTTGKPPVTAQSTTQIIFCNFAAPGFLSQQTIAITENSSSGLIIPTIGDTVAVAQLPGYTPGSSIEVLAPVALPQQYIITGIEVNATNLFITPDVAQQITIFLYLQEGFESQYPQANVRLWAINLRPEIENATFFSLNQETGLNIPVQSLYFVSTIFPGSPLITLPDQIAITCNVTYALVTK